MSTPLVPPRVAVHAIEPPTASAMRPLANALVCAVAALAIMLATLWTVAMPPAGAPPDEDATPASPETQDGNASKPPAPYAWGA